VKTEKLLSQRVRYQASYNIAYSTACYLSIRVIVYSFIVYSVSLNNDEREIFRYWWWYDVYTFLLRRLWATISNSWRLRRALSNGNEYSIETCKCHWWTSYSETEFHKISDLIELRCDRCHGLVGWVDESTRTIIPLKRSWSHEERLDMK